MFDRVAYAKALQAGAAAYVDEFVLLRSHGLDPRFTQTGGMCGAIEVPLERGMLLITDSDDSLPWDRSSLRGWGVGHYDSNDYSEGPGVFVCHDENTAPEKLLELIEECFELVRR